MSDHDLLAERFEEHRTQLRSVAYRMLGSLAEADDAVQETWLRASASGADGIDNLGGWLTTITGRICLNMLRSRATRREDVLDVAPEPRAEVGDPEQEVLLADSVGPALLVVLDRLTPAERLAFVLHDMFAVPFEDVAPIVERTPAATRQLASRARRRVQSPDAVPLPDLPRQREMVDAFLAASREGDFDALLALLDPDVVMRTDGSPMFAGVFSDARGAATVATNFSGRAQAAQLALVDDAPALAWAPHGKLRVLFTFTVDGDHITEIALYADRAHLDSLHVVLVDPTT
jgi:RNA polymerase sigma factor (sigma-70 family)